MNQSLFHSFALSHPPSLQADWLAFRGSNGNGSFDQRLPFPVLEKRQWLVTISARPGLSSPILVDDLVLLTASSGPNQQTLHILAFDARDGSLEWERKFKATGRTVCHEKTCVAACTLVSDGKKVIAQFSSNGVFCLDLKGQMPGSGLTFDYPNAANGLSMSSSPFWPKGWLSFRSKTMPTPSLSASIWPMDSPCGKRPAQRANWTSPIVMREQGREIVALQSKDGISAIEASSGEEIWSFEEERPPSFERLVRTGPRFGSFQWVDRFESELHGRTTRTNLEREQAQTGNRSPTVVKDKVYVVNSANVLSCAEVTSGKSCGACVSKAR